MFLKSKYIFETQTTKAQRYFYNILASIVILFVLYSIACMVFVNVSNLESSQSESALFNRPPDLIVVFTGDKGRIPLAIKLAKKYKQSRIFITGVHSRNSVETLINPLNQDELIDSNLLEIDYLARNTFENALATYRFLQKNKDLKRVLIISHDYHIMRIKKLMNGIENTSDKYEFHYTGVKTDYKSFRNLKILFKEVFKLIRTNLFLMMWDKGFESPRVQAFD